MNKYKLTTNDCYLFGRHCNANCTFMFDSLADCGEAMQELHMGKVHIETPNGSIYAFNTQWGSYLYESAWDTRANWKLI